MAVVTPEFKEVARKANKSEATVSVWFTTRGTATVRATWGNGWSGRFRQKSWTKLDGWAAIQTAQAEAAEWLARQVAA